MAVLGQPYCYHLMMGSPPHYQPAAAHGAVAAGALEAASAQQQAASQQQLYAELSSAFAEYSEIAELHAHDSAAARRRLQTLEEQCHGRAITGQRLLQLLRLFRHQIGWERMVPDEFSRFYRFVFHLCKPLGKKHLQVDLALEAWRLLLAQRFALLERWCDYMQHHNPGLKVISEDQWKQLLEFSRVVSQDLSNYDFNGAWACFLDEFVEHCYRAAPHLHTHRLAALAHHAGGGQQQAGYDGVGGVGGVEDMMQGSQDMLAAAPQGAGHRPALMASSRPLMAGDEELAPSSSSHLLQLGPGGSSSGAALLLPPAAPGHAWGAPLTGALPGGGAAASLATYGAQQQHPQQQQPPLLVPGLATAGSEDGTGVAPSSPRRGSKRRSPDVDVVVERLSAFPLPSTASEDLAAAAAAAAQGRAAGGDGGGGGGAFGAAFKRHRPEPPPPPPRFAVPAPLAPGASLLQGGAVAHPAAGLLAEGAPLAAPDGLLPQLPPHSLVMAMLGEALAGHSSGGGGPAGGGMAGGPQQQHAAAAGDAQFLHPQQQQQQQQHMMMMAAQQQQQQQVLAAGGFGGAAAGPASSMMVELPVLQVSARRHIRPRRSNFSELVNSTVSETLFLNE